MVGSTTYYVKAGGYCVYKQPENSCSHSGCTTKMKFLGQDFQEKTDRRTHTQTRSNTLPTAFAHVW